MFVVGCGQTFDRGGKQSKRLFKVKSAKQIAEVVDADGACQ
jgi:hypothetical protein